MQYFIFPNWKPKIINMLNETRSTYFEKQWAIRSEHGFIYLSKLKICLRWETHSQISKIPLSWCSKTTMRTGTSSKNFIVSSTQTPNEFANHHMKEPGLQGYMQLPILIGHRTFFIHRNKLQHIRTYKVLSRQKVITHRYWRTNTRYNETQNENYVEIYQSFII